MVLSMKRHLACTVLVIVYLVCLTTTIACLVYAIEKRKAFADNGIMLSNGTIEILYLLLIIATIISVAVSTCCSVTSNEPNILGDGGTALIQFIVAIIWLTFPAAYTVITMNELNDVPLFCSNPSKYDSSLLHTCIKRRNNFIFMWVNSGIMLLSTVTLCFCFYGMEIKSEEDIILESIAPISSNNSESSTPPVLKRLNPYFCKPS